MDADKTYWGMHRMPGVLAVSAIQSGPGDSFRAVIMFLFPNPNTIITTTTGIRVPWGGSDGSSGSGFKTPAQNHSEIYYLGDKFLDRTPCAPPAQRRQPSERRVHQR
jgi:hypothetical protein